MCITGYYYFIGIIGRNHSCTTFTYSYNINGKPLADYDLSVITACGVVGASENLFDSNVLNLP